MNTNLEIFFNVVGTVLMLTAIPALWISGRILLRNLISKDRSTQLFLWLVLGGFFNIPLVDILSNPGNLIAQAIPSDQTELPVRIGTTSIILNLMIYAFAIYYGQRIIAKHNLPFMNELNLTSLERGFIVLGLAGLFNHAVRGIVINFILLAFTPGTIN